MSCRLSLLLSCVSSLASLLRVCIVSAASALYYCCRYSSRQGRQIRCLKSALFLYRVRLHLGSHCFRIGTSHQYSSFSVLTVLLCASVWTSNPVFCRPLHRPDPAPLRPGQFFGVRHGRGERGVQGGLEPPCPESKATRPQPGALDLPPHVSTASYFVLGGAHYVGYYI